MAGCMGWAWTGAVALVCGCGPDAGQSDADCDADAIVPLLVTRSDESAQLVGRADETWVFEVRTYPMDVADIVASDEFWPVSIGTRVLAVDGCGAEPRSIAEGFDSVYAPPSAERPWLAARTGEGPTTGIYRIDPVGRTEPVRIAAGPATQFLWTVDGVLVVDGTTDDPSTLVHVTFDADGGIHKTTLREDVERLASNGALGTVYERVAFVSTQDQLFVLDLASGDERLVRVGTVSATSYDAQSRALVVFGGVGEPGHVIDVDGGVDIELIQGGDSVVTMSGPEFIASMIPNDEGTAETQIVWLPELREFRGEGRWLSLGRSPDGAIRMLQGPDAIQRLDADTDVPIPVRQGIGYATVADDRIWVAEDVAPVVDAPFARRGMRLLRMQMDGSEPQDLLGQDVLNVLQMDGDLWVVLTEQDDDNDLAQIEAVDLATGDREPLLDGVLTVGSVGPSQFVDDDANDALVERVSPEDPDGNGIWLVHRDRVLR